MVTLDSIGCVVKQYINLTLVLGAIDIPTEVLGADWGSKQEQT